MSSADAIRERAIARKRREDYQRLLDFITSTNGGST